MACNSNEEMPTPTPPVVVEPEPMPVDRKTVLTNIYDNALTPAYAVFVEEAEKLVVAVTAFNANPNETNLQAAQSQWVIAKTTWEQAEVYDVGNLNSSFAHNRIDKYPTRQKFIEDNLDRTAAIDEAFVENAGSTAKGLPALEYLLFRAEDEMNILTQFTTGTRAEQYRNYSLALAENLVKQGKILTTAVAEERDDFINNAGDGINTSLNDWVNAQVAILEEIKSNKIDKPLGLTNGGNINLEKLETPFAKADLAAIKGNLLGLQNSLTIDTARGSILTLLDQIDIEETEKLSLAILNALDNSITIIDSFEAPLSETITTNKEKVETLSSSIADLLILVKNDMSSRLGITVVFNDTDGD